MPVNEVPAGNVAAIHILTSNIIPPKYVDYIVLGNRTYLTLYKLALVTAFIANYMMFQKQVQNFINKCTRCNSKTFF